MPHTLSIIVPVYNEQSTIADVMLRLRDVWPDAQCIYVDDGSRDSSLQLLHEHALPSDIVLTKENGGKGSAIRMGLLHATGDYTVIQDADLEYDPADIRLLLSEAQAHPGAVVFGSRFLRSNPNLYRRYLWGNRVMSAFASLLFGTWLTDTYTCYKLLPTPLFQSLPLTARGFELEAELCALPMLAGVPIREVPISYKPRSLEEGKKIRLRDAWIGASTLLKLRLQRPRKAS